MPLIIWYEPPSSPLDHRGWEKYHREYVAPLGRGRKKVHLTHSEVTIESNQPGMLDLAANLLDVALTKIGMFRLEPVEELNPPGGWYGDLEPDSPTLLIERIGSPIDTPNGFHYETPPFLNNYRPALESGSTIELGAGLYEGRPEAVIRGTASALMSLAKHAIYLSQAPDGATIVYGKNEVKNEKSRLVFERTPFREDVPWAKVPSSK